MTTTIGIGAGPTSASFTKVPLHLPNSNGDVYKTELVEERSPERTIKWNFWHLPDVDGPRSKPHNHPWKDDDGVSFRSTIIAGGYTEKRFWVETDHEGRKHVKTSEHTYKAGDVNVMPFEVFHLVTAVEPGTVARMVCGKGVPNAEWGYLDVETGEYAKAEKDPDFQRRLQENNRFLIKK